MRGSAVVSMPTSQHSFAFNILAPEWGHAIQFGLVHALCGLKILQGKRNMEGQRACHLRDCIFRLLVRDSPTSVPEGFDKSCMGIHWDHSS